MDNDFATGYALGADSNGGNCRNDGWGGDWIWAFLIFALFGWGNGGFGGGFGGGNGVQGALTRADLCQDMNFQGVENGIRGIQQGLCDGFYAQNTTMMEGFHGVDNAVCQLGYNVQQGFNAANVVALQNQNALQTQLAQCCCENRQGQADIKYQMATDTCAIQNTIQSTTRDIIDNQNANYRGLMDFMVQRDMDNLRAENQNLKLAASQAAQNNYLVEQLRPAAKPAYLTCSPFASSYGFGYGYNNGGYGYNNSGCGCNSGCGSCC